MPVTNADDLLHAALLTLGSKTDKRRTLQEQQKITFDFPQPGTPRTRLLQTIPHPRTQRARLVSGVAGRGMITGVIEPYTSNMVGYYIL